MGFKHLLLGVVCVLVCACARRAQVCGVSYGGCTPWELAARLDADARWHEQEARYSAFVQQAADKRLLLLEFGVGFNTPVIIRMPFERMAAQLPDTTLVRFNRDYPQPYQAGIEHFIPFTEDINRIISQLNHH